MTDDGVDASAMIRRAIGGDAGAIGWIVAEADRSEVPAIVAVAAVLEWAPDRLVHAWAIASTSRDRQLVAIAEAHLVGDHDLVDALARDHLVDHPDSLIVAWIASDAVVRARQSGLP